MLIEKYLGRRKLEVINTSAIKLKSFKELLNLNTSIPYKSEVYFKFSDKLIQNEYEGWVKANKN